MITEELRNKVIVKVKECKEIAKIKTNLDLPPINILFDLIGRRAGEARTWRKEDGTVTKTELRLNQFYLNKYPDDMINRTIPHEMAHIVADKLYNMNCYHGYYWQQTMRNVYGLEPVRTHSYGPSDTARHIRLWTLQCKYCGFVYKMTSKGKNKLVRNGVNRHYCGRCRNNFLPDQEFFLTNEKG